MKTIKEAVASETHMENTYQMVHKIFDSHGKYTRGLDWWKFR